MYAGLRSTVWNPHIWKNACKQFFVVCPLPRHHVAVESKDDEEDVDEPVDNHGWS